MVTFVTVVHIVVCVFLAVIVLLQHGKGADMGAAFGGGGQSIFGAQGATTILQKMTAWAAAIFLITSLLLTYFSSRKSTDSLLKPTGKSASTVSPTPTATPSPAAGVLATPTPAAPVTLKVPAKSIPTPHVTATPTSNK